MVLANAHYKKLKQGYLFPEIERRSRSFQEKHPEKSLLNLGIGDISEPLLPSVISAIIEATKEMGKKESIKGYGPSQGYAFLQEAICSHDYASLKISPDEIFVSDGSKCDCANIQELFSSRARIAICDPTYPVYLDTNVMAGRSGRRTKEGLYEKFIYLPCTEENSFLPKTPSQPCDLIYLCSPNNPTGVALTYEELKKWVDYAHNHHAILLFDAAYEAFITNSQIPHSIFAIEGAHEVACEFRSFSKSAGFTGLRCSSVVIPKALKVFVGSQKISLHSLWKRRSDTKFGGVAYPIQKGAEALYSSQGKKEMHKLLQSYKKRTQKLYQEMKKLGYTLYGGIDSPYLWCKTLHNLSSWEFFDFLLEKTGMISIPGSGFGPSGEGFVRLSCFAKNEVIDQVLKRLADAKITP